MKKSEKSDLQAEMNLSANKFIVRNNIEAIYGEAVVTVIKRAFSAAFLIATHKAEEKQSDETKELKEVLKVLLENRPDTYSGTDINAQQRKMFAFQSAVNRAVELIRG